MDTINYIKVNGTTYEISGNIDTSTLMKVATTLSNVPTVTTLSHNGTQFVVGDIVRVADQSSTTGYSFYRLHKIENNQALWAKLDTGTIDDSATITVSMNSNQNETFTSGSATISYTHNNTTVTDTQSGATAIFTDIPAGVSYTISFGTVNGYATPSNVTGTTATFGRPSHTVTYNTELVSVTTEQNGATLYVNGIEYTEPVKIAWGSTYTVTGSTVAGYSVSSETITASQNSRTVTVTYDELRSGIYVMDANGNEIDAAQATSSCIGVVVRDADKGVAFLIPKVTSADTTMYWNNNTSTTVSGVTTTTDVNAAKVDYKGVANSNAMRSFDASTSYAAGFCNSKTITIGGITKNGYLGSCGEWYLAWQNKSAIDTALSQIGSVALKNSYYWTSTQRSRNYAWVLYWRSSEDVYYNSKDRSYYVRPFYDLT